MQRCIMFNTYNGNSFPEWKLKFVFYFSGDEEDDAFADMLRSGERSPNSGFTNLGLDYEDADNLPDWLKQK